MGHVGPGPLLHHNPVVLAWGARRPPRVRHNEPLVVRRPRSLAEGSGRARTGRAEGADRQSAAFGVQAEGGQGRRSIVREQAQYGVLRGVAAVQFQHSGEFLRAVADGVAAERDGTFVALQ